MGNVNAGVSRPLTIMVIIGTAVIGAHVFGYIDIPFDVFLSAIWGVWSTAENITAENDSPTVENGSREVNGIHRDQVEVYVHEEVNAVREENDVSPLDWDPALQEIARYHSGRMATEEFVAHTAPDGETLRDRYEKFGYECRIETSSNTYMAGAENIAKTYHHENVIGQGRLTTEREVAEAIVESWMASAGHRENLLTAEWENEGIGVYLTEENEVYATQNFC